MFIANKYRLYPTKTQAEQLSQFCGSVRWLWNYMLDLNQKEYKENKKFVFGYGMATKIPDLKKEHPWLKEVPSQSLQQKCLDLDVALKRSFKKTSGFPKFKAKNKSKDSFRIPQLVSNGKDLQIKTNSTHVKIPKLGLVKWKLHRPIEGKLKSITISRDVDQWYVSVLTDVPDVQKTQIDRNKVIGIDLGISSFAALSDGTKIASPCYLKRRLKYLRKYQRQLAKKKLGSNNRKKAVLRVARTYQQIRNQRLDWLHKTSNEITNKYDLICLEDLKTKSLMMGSKNRSLNRAISDQGWYGFTQMLKYKAERKGKYTTKISQWDPSTKTCSHCGHKTGKMALDIRNWTCPKCGSEHDRDTNAALNIKFWGMMNVDYTLFMEDKNTDGMSGIYACGDTRSLVEIPDQVSVKQEATRSLVVW